MRIAMHRSVEVLVYRWSVTTTRRSSSAQTRPCVHVVRRHAHTQALLQLALGCMVHAPSHAKLRAPLSVRPNGQCWIDCQARSCLPCRHSRCSGPACHMLGAAATIATYAASPCSSARVPRQNRPSQSGIVPQPQPSHGPCNVTCACANDGCHDCNHAVTPSHGRATDRPARPTYVHTRLSPTGLRPSARRPPLPQTLEQACMHPTCVHAPSAGVREAPEANSERRERRGLGSGAGFSFGRGESGEA